MKLTCPICGLPLTKINKSAVCEKQHSFDYAKQGYLNLLIKQSVDHGDNKEMVQARTDFLNSGGYAFLKDELVSITRELQPDVLADLGCGEGYYTKDLLANEKYGFDMSKDALKHAARNDKSTQYAVASIFHLPMNDNDCDVILTCFAPFAKDEIERILKINGKFIFVSPAPKHLWELKSFIYETPYENEIKTLETAMSLQNEYVISNTFHCRHDELIALFKMTPYFHRTKSNDLQKLDSIDEMDITASFVIRIYQKTR